MTQQFRIESESLRDQINKLLTNPKMGGEKTGETGETGDAEPTDTPTDEPAEEPAEEEPEA